MTSPMTLSQQTIEVISGPHAGRSGVLVQDRLRSQTLRDEQGKFDVWKKDTDVLIPVSVLAEALADPRFTSDGVELVSGATVSFLIGAKRMSGEVIDVLDGIATIDVGNFEVCKPVPSLAWTGGRR